MIVFVDYEHESGRSKPWGERLLAARTRITYQLEDLSGQHCMLVRYDKLSPELLDRIGATAMFISGNSASPSRYESASLEPLAEIVTGHVLPIFGFCGGFQAIAHALGADVVPLGEATEPPSESSPYPSDVKHEFGYFPVQVTKAHPLLDGLADPVVRHSHALHVPIPPAGYDVIAATDMTPVQMAVDDANKIVGTQFHPESWTDEHPAGRRMIENFLAWAGSTPA